jgi:hypothetical protein
MRRSLSWLSPYEEALPTIFDEYLKEVQGLPITSERLLWDRSALREKDKEIEVRNQRFRDPVFDACWVLIDRFAETLSEGQ